MVCSRDCVSWTQLYSEALKRTMQAPRRSLHLIPSQTYTSSRNTVQSRGHPRSLIGICQRLVKDKCCLTLSLQIILAQRADCKDSESLSPTVPIWLQNVCDFFSPNSLPFRNHPAPPRQHLQIHLVLSQPRGRATRTNAGTVETKSNLATK